MPPWLAGRLDPAVGSLRTAMADRAVRRLVVAWFAVVAGKWTLLVTTLVIAYDRGGPVAVGILGVVRYLTPAIVAPFAGVPASRWTALAVLRATNIGRTVAAIGVAVVVATDAPFAALALMVGIEAGIGAFTRPCHMGLLPACANTPGQLVAANVTSSAAEGLGTFVGPAVAGILLVSIGPLGAVVAVAAIYAACVAAIARADIAIVGRRGGPATPAVVLADILAGVRAIRELPGPRLVILGFAAQTFVRGALTVLTVVASIELLGIGQGGVGALNAAMGLGGLIGAGASLTLAGQARLGPAFIAALVGWGAPIALIGLVISPIVALAAMFAIGLSNSFLDVAGYTLVQRTTPNQARIAMLGLIDGVSNLGPALGGLVAPLMIASLGVEGALVLTGAILPVVAVALGVAARTVDEGGPAAARRVELLRTQPLFAPLSLATVEHLAAILVSSRFDAGALLIREGDVGEDYFLIDEGEVEILQGQRRLRALGPGHGVGEIALIHEVPRTASVRAISPVTAFRMDREAFLEAVTGHPASHAAAVTVASQRLAADHQGGG
jgi:Cyclic nucleotide-binding domain/Major Facilitator Superfamily